MAVQMLGTNRSNLAGPVPWATLCVCRRGECPPQPDNCAA